VQSKLNFERPISKNIYQFRCIETWTRHPSLSPLQVDPRYPIMDNAHAFVADWNQLSSDFDLSGKPDT